MLGSTCMFVVQRTRQLTHVYRVHFVDDTHILCIRLTETASPQNQKANMYLHNNSFATKLVTIQMEWLSVSA